MFFEKLYQKIGVKSNRTKNITKHVFASFIYKGGSIVASFLIVPLTIKFLDTENYGIWLTLSSLISWFSFFDIGLGHGLRNKFAEAKADGDFKLAQAYVSTAYFTIGIVCAIMIFLFLSLNYFIDWATFFNASKSMKHDLNILMPVVFSFFCIQLVVKLIATIYTADQHHSMQGKITFYTNLITLITIWMLTFTSKSSLLLFGTFFSIFPVLILIGLNYFAFSKRYYEFRPKLNLYKKEYLKDICGLGMKFFILQICGIILFTSDNLIISKLFSPADVVPYNLVYKYFSIVTMGFSIILAPYWSTFTEASKKEDWEWIRLSMKNLLKLMLPITFIFLIMILLSDYSFKLWIGDKLTIPFSLTISIGCFFILNNYISIYTVFLNGVGKIKLQTFQAVGTAIINIPLSIFFASFLKMGPKGVITATIMCSLPALVLGPIQYHKIINKKATGIFNS